MDPLRIQYTVQEADVKKSLQILSAKINKSMCMIFLAAICVAFTLMFFASAFAEKQEAYEQLPPMVKSLTYILGLYLSFFFVYKFFIHYFPIQICHPQGINLCPKDVIIDDDGLHCTTAHTTGTIKWGGIMKIEERDGYILFYVDLTAAHFIPNSSFSSPAEASDFAAHARILWQAARIKAREQAPTSPWQQARVVREEPDGDNSQH